jgi:hypothetical protein
LIWIGIFNETFSHYADEKWHTNAVNFNIYSLVEFILIMWQFKKWKAFANKKVYAVITGVALLFWVGENFLFGTITSFNSYFIIGGSLCIALTSIRMINYWCLEKGIFFLKMRPF